ALHDRRTARDDRADMALGNRRAVIVDDADFVARERTAAADQPHGRGRAIVTRYRDGLNQAVGTHRVDREAVARERDGEGMFGQAVTRKEPRRTEPGARETLGERGERVGPNGLGAAAGDAPAR